MTYLGASLMRANLPKSSPSFRVATVPLPWITTSTDPFRRMYHDRPSSPWLNTVIAYRYEMKWHRKRKREKWVRIQGEIPSNVVLFTSTWTVHKFRRKMVSQGKSKNHLQDPAVIAQLDMLLTSIIAYDVLLRIPFTFAYMVVVFARRWWLDGASVCKCKPCISSERDVCRRMRVAIFECINLINSMLRAAMHWNSKEHNGMEL